MFADALLTGIVS